MKIAIQSTSTITTIDGVPVRLWEGTTEHGIPVKVFIHRLAVSNAQDCSAFEAELKEVSMPTELVERHRTFGDILFRSAIDADASDDEIEDEEE